MNYFHGFGMMPGWGFFDPLGMLFGWIIFFVIIAVVIRAFGGRRHWMHDHGHHGHDSALDILQQRFAKGEITKEQYNEMKKTLET